MKKQVDFAFRLLPYSQVNPDQSSASWSKYVRENYLELGWEVQSTEIARVDGNEVFLGITLVRYEDVSALEPVLEGVRNRATSG